jgi:hypothetical protein
MPTLPGGAGVGVCCPQQPASNASCAAATSCHKDRAMDKSFLEFTRSIVADPVNSRKAS